MSDTAALDGMTAELHRSEDGTLVVSITPPPGVLHEGRPDIRVWVGDALIYAHGQSGDNLEATIVPDVYYGDGTKYRCTRHSLYLAGPGHLDLSAREGHYVTATSYLDAQREMARRFPEDAHGFSATACRPMRDLDGEG